MCTAKPESESELNRYRVALGNFNAPTHNDNVASNYMIYLMTVIDGMMQTAAHWSSTRISGALCEWCVALGCISGRTIPRIARTHFVIVCDINSFEGR